MNEDNRMLFLLLKDVRFHFFHGVFRTNNIDTCLTTEPDGKKGV